MLPGFHLRDHQDQRHSHLAQPSSYRASPTVSLSRSLSCLLSCLFHHAWPYGLPLLFILPSHSFMHTCVRASNDLASFYPSFLLACLQACVASKYYPIPVCGPILSGTVAGCFGSVCVKGLALFQTEMPWLVQGSFYASVYYHLMVTPPPLSPAPPSFWGRPSFQTADDSLRLCVCACVWPWFRCTTLT